MLAPVGSVLVPEAFFQSRDQRLYCLERGFDAGAITIVFGGEELLGAGRGSLGEFFIDTGGSELCSQVRRDDGGCWAVQAGGEVCCERVAWVRTFGGYGGKEEILGAASSLLCRVGGASPPLPHGTQSEAQQPG